MAIDSAVSSQGVSALILGAGSGTRLGGMPKAFLQLQTQTLLERAILAVEPFCSEIVVGLRAADLALGQSVVDRLAPAQRVVIVAGGTERQDTVARLVEIASSPLVLLHEVARPFAQAESFAAVLEAAQLLGAAALYTELAVRDALGLMRNGTLATALPRARVVAMQTPQAYHQAILYDAHERAQRSGQREEGTPALVRWAGYEVKLVRGCPGNIKITYPEDWERVLATGALSPASPTVCR
jgi:2-C-methyl-D-erythritol 4-phosphate cytidylyltransferase